MTETAREVAKEPSLADMAERMSRQLFTASQALLNAKEAMDSRDDDGAYRIIKHALKELERPA